MTSFNPDVNALHQAYLDVTGYELELSGPDERRWFDALKWHLTPDDVKLVVKGRIKGICKGERREASLYLRNLIGDEDMLAEFKMELAAIRATMRVPAHCHGKVQVLMDTHREAVIPTPDAKHISEIMDQMRKAVQ